MVELVLHHLFLDRLLLGLEEVVAGSTKEQPELVDPVVAEMVLILLQLLGEMEQQILAVERVAAEVLMEALFQTAARADPVSSFFAIQSNTQSPTPAVVLHSPLQLLETIRSQLSLQVQETLHSNHNYGTLRIFRRKQHSH
jgi:hypothetical protein